MEEQIACLIEAGKRLGIPHHFLDRDHNVVALEVHSERFIFQSNRTPFNREAHAGICLDKDHTYQLLHDVVRMPASLAFFDFSLRDKYKRYVRHDSLEAMVAEVEATLVYPVVVKRNRGALGKNVFLCQDGAQVAEAIGRIFDRAIAGFDYVAQVQHYIPARQEYRFVCFEGSPVLAYERFAEAAGFKARFWELEGGRTIQVRDEAVLAALLDFVAPVFKRLRLGMVGFDVLRSHRDELYLLELNSGPRFDHFIQDHGRVPIIHMYEQILRQLLARDGRDP